MKSDKKGVEIEVEEGVVELKTKQFNKKVKRGERAIYKKTKKGIKIGKAEFKFKLWIKSLEIEFKKMGKEIKQSSKQIEKESKKVKKESKKIGSDFKKAMKKIMKKEK